MPHFKEEWRERASIDYFSHFLALWVGFNSWYVDYYKDYEYKSSKGKTIQKKQDLHFISILKTEFQTPENIMYNKFYDLLFEGGKKALKFKADLEALHYSLNSIDNLLYFDRLGNSYKMTFNYVNINAFDAKKPNYLNLIAELSSFEEVKSGYEVNEEQENVFEDIEPEQAFTTILVSYLVTASSENFFSGIIEILYKVRCSIVHGFFNPQDEYSYEVVKYCYYILLALME